MTELIEDPERAKNSLKKLPKKYIKYQEFINNVLKKENDEYILSCFNIINKSTKDNIERIVPFSWEIEYEVFTKYSKSNNLDYNEDFITWFTNKYKVLKKKENEQN